MNSYKGKLLAFFVTFVSAFYSVVSHAMDESKPEEWLTKGRKIGEGMGGTVYAWDKYPNEVLKHYSETRNWGVPNPSDEDRTYTKLEGTDATKAPNFIVPRIKKYDENNMTFRYVKGQTVLDWLKGNEKVTLDVFIKDFVYDAFLGLEYFFFKVGYHLDDIHEENLMVESQHLVGIDYELTSNNPSSRALANILLKIMDSNKVDNQDDVRYTKLRNYLAVLAGRSSPSCLLNQDMLTYGDILRKIKLLICPNQESKYTKDNIIDIALDYARMSSENKDFSYSNDFNMDDIKKIYGELPHYVYQEPTSLLGRLIDDLRTMKDWAYLNSDCEFSPDLYLFDQVLKKWDLAVCKMEQRNKKMKNINLFKPAKDKYVDIFEKVTGLDGDITSDRNAHGYFGVDIRKEIKKREQTYVREHSPNYKGIDKSEPLNINKNIKRHLNIKVVPVPTESEIIRELEKIKK